MGRHPSGIFYSRSVATSNFVVEPNEDFKKQTYAEMDAAVAKIRSLGAKVVEDVPMISLADVTKDPRSVKEIEQLFGK